MLGVIRGWGAAPLPSPPVGGRAGSGARAQRTGSSCGPWGPWQAAARSWDVWLSSAPLTGAAGGACCAREEGEHYPRTQENPALHEGNARGPGGLGSGALLQRPAQGPRPGLRVPAPWLRATGLGSGAPAPGLSSPWVSAGCPRPCSTSFCLSPPLPSSSPRLCCYWLHPTGPNPGVPARPLCQGLAPRRLEGGLRGKRPMSIEKRVLPRLGGGCGVRARARGAAGGPPAVSPELSVALLMESSGDAKGKGQGQPQLQPGFWP